MARIAGSISFEVDSRVDLNRLSNDLTNIISGITKEPCNVVVNVQNAGIIGNRVALQERLNSLTRSSIELMDKLGPGER